MGKIIFFTFLWVLLICIPAAIIHNGRGIPAVAAEFRVDPGDLRVFLKNTDYSLHDFETSAGVRACFAKWQKGEGVIGQKTQTVPVIIPIATGR